MIMFDLSEIPVRLPVEDLLWGALEQRTPGGRLAIAEMEEPCSCLDADGIEDCESCGFDHCQHYHCSADGSDWEFNLVEYPDEARMAYLLGWYLVADCATDCVPDVAAEIDRLFPGEISGGLAPADADLIRAGASDAVRHLAPEAARRG